MEQETGLEPVKSCFADSRLARFGISCVALRGGFEPPGAGLESASLTIGNRSVGIGGPREIRTPMHGGVSF